MNQRGFTELPLSQWAAFREAQATAPNGPLSIIAMHPVFQTPAGADATPQTIEGVPGQWVHPHGADHVTLTATDDDEIVVDGAPVTGEITLRAEQEIRFSPSLTGRLGREVYGTFFLQLSDSQADALRTFDRIERYPEDPTWVLDATFAPAEASFTIGTAVDPSATHERAAPGVVRFERDGQAYELACMETFMPGVLMVIVMDATSGVETPAQGRLYLIPEPEQGPVTLDFNRLMLSPHEFSAAYPCPVPPLSNRVSPAINAGEKRVVHTP